jgi:hypothetical protein
MNINISLLGELFVFHISCSATKCTAKPEFKNSVIIMKGNWYSM